MIIATNQYESKNWIKSYYKKFYPNEKLKVLGFSLSTRMKDEINKQIIVGFAKSLSEFVRNSIYDLINDSIKRTDNFTTPFEFTINEEKLLKKIKKEKYTEDKGCTKMPKNFKKILDLFFSEIKKNTISDKIETLFIIDIIRLAIEKSLNANKKILLEYNIQY